MPVRLPAVAGRFYADNESQCRRELLACLPTQPFTPDGATPVGGLMPHAGWMCSGRVAGQVAAAIAQTRMPQTIVVFGAVHFWHGSRAAVFPEGTWVTPLGAVQIDADLAQHVLAEDDDLFESNPRAHNGEHSIEVEVPFLQHVFPAARLLPIMVPPSPDSADVGAAVGRACRAAGLDAAFIASSDLTHYGPAYGFTPQGVGAQGLTWATQTNDRRIIDLMLALRAEEIVAEAKSHYNACGAGAIAATIAACRELGADRGVLLQHTNSYEVLRKHYHEAPTDAVGYAGIIFVAPQ